MGTTPVRQALQWMGEDGQTGSVLLTAKRLLAMETAIAAVLPTGLSKGFAVSQVQGTELTLTAENSAFSSKLRQLQPRILAELARAGWNITTLRVRVSAHAGRPVQSKPVRQVIALDNSDLTHFERLETSLRPGPVADAVKRLVRRHRQAS